jgi:hypothetical protein
MVERRLTPHIATQEEVDAIKGMARGNGNTMFEQAVKRGGDASRADKVAAAMARAIDGKPIEEPKAPEAPKAPEPVKPLEPVAAKPAEPKAPEPVKAPEIKPKEAEAIKQAILDANKPPELPKAEPYKFTKDYIAQAKAAVEELRGMLGNEKFAELEPRIEKGLASDNFEKNAKGGYDAKANVFDIALKAQGFVGVPTPEEKEERVADVREAASVKPSPVVELPKENAPKTQKDWVKDLKSGDPVKKKAAMYHLIGVDETADQLKGMLGRK